MLRKILFFSLTLICVVVSTATAVAQHPIAPTVVKGVVRDSLTRDPLPFVAIFLRGSDRGIMTDAVSYTHLTLPTNLWV